MIFGLDAVCAAPSDSAHQDERQMIKAVKQEQRSQLREQLREQRGLRQHSLTPQDSDDQLEAGRRNGRLTREERRDLRRQINEAGHGIYSPQTKP